VPSAIGPHKRDGAVLVGGFLKFSLFRSAIIFVRIAQTYEQIDWTRVDGFTAKGLPTRVGQSSVPARLLRTRAIHS
jgi:hypothetical protein